MKDTLYEQFCSIENLKLAFSLLKKELETINLRTEPLGTPAFNTIEIMGDRYFKALSQLLLNGEYEPQKPETLFAKKENLGDRRVAVLNITDKIVYQALLNPLILGNALKCKYSTICNSPNISDFLERDGFLEPYKQKHNEFKDNQIRVCEMGYNYAITLDINNYFDSIRIKDLIDTLKNYAGIYPNKLLELLNKMLLTWAIDGIEGIPQGPETSSLLSNLFLSSIDEQMVSLIDKEVYIFRYQDDYVLMGKSKDTVYKEVNTLIGLLNKFKLNINYKTRIRIVTKDILEKEKFSGDYEDSDTPLSKEHLAEITPKIPEILDKINRNNFIDITKQDISDLKYYLKSPITPPTETLNSLIKALPDIQHLIVEATQFIHRAIRVYYNNDNLKKIVTLWKSRYFFPFPYIWISKLILNQCIPNKGVQENEYKILVLSEISTSLYKDSNWLNKCIGNYFLSTTKSIGIEETLDNLVRAQNEYEKSIYIDILIENANEIKGKNKIIELLQHNSPDINILAIRLLEKIGFSRNELPSNCSIFTSYFLGINRAEHTSSKEETAKIVVNNTSNFYYNTNIAIKMGLEREQDVIKYPIIILNGEAEILLYIDSEKKEHLWEGISQDTLTFKFFQYFSNKGINYYVPINKMLKYLEITRYGFGDTDQRAKKKVFENMFNSKIKKELLLENNDLFEINNANFIHTKVPVLVDKLRNEEKYQ